MPQELKPRTADVNGAFWGASARDWADIQEGQFGSAYATVLERCGVNSTTRYLDAGCGAGMAAQTAANRHARVSGVDASEALLAIARDRVPDGEFRRADLEELPFAEDSFDLVTGFNSFQFAGNPVVALAEARRVTRPGGTVVVLTWGEPEGMPAASLIAALRPLLPAPPPGAPGPFALSDPQALRGFAEKAGLSPVAIHDGELDWSYPDLETGLRGLASSGVSARAVEHSGREALDRAHTEALAPFRTPEGGYRIGARYRYMMATA